MQITVVFDNHSGYRKGLIGHHGFSALVEANNRRVLVDTGSDGRVLLSNMDQLGIDPEKIDALFITHGHYDHTGGLEELLLARRNGLDVYGHPRIFERRVALKPRWREIGIPFKREHLEELGARFHLSPNPVEFLPGFISSGEVERKHWDRAVGYLVREEELIRDPVKDDMALIIKENGSIVVITGCGHSGVLNIAEHSKRLTGSPIKALIGGFHMRGANEVLLIETVERLKRMGVEKIFPGHCTGVEEYAYLKVGFKEAEALHVGKTIKI